MASVPGVFVWGRWACLVQVGRGRAGLASVLYREDESCAVCNDSLHSTEWDILQLLSINVSQTGVSAARGPIPDTPAWRLRALYDNIQIDSSIVPKIASTLHDQLSLYFVYKQHKKTLGSLLSINLPGKIKPFLQIVSNLKTQHLNFFYHIKEDTKTHQASFQLPDKGSIQMAKLMNYSEDDRVWKCSYDSQFGPGWRPPLLG
ncbi:Kielin/chordin-like protein-like 3 [Homarus americanus]|uniref:Kielin/chordin-like protein-like 3 n=1 Tax=Homarus americanus TaxID=6706 RepID=A0A8J5N638_HOMAM|nr:Kielin/chordin-like protein-like 3 [Homarus americanus]